MILRSSRFLCSVALILGLGSLRAAAPLDLDFSQNIPVQPAEGVKLISPSPGAQSFELKDSERGKALVLDKPGQKLLFDGAWDAGKPYTVFVIVRADFEPEIDANGEKGRWVFDGSASEFRQVARIAWKGSTLGLYAGEAFNREDQNGMFIPFSSEELGSIKGKWLLIGFSVQQDGRAFGICGTLDGNKPILRAAQVLGAGKMAVSGNKRFAMGGPVVENAKIANDISIARLVVYPQGLSPEQLLAAFDAARAGKNLASGLTPADAARTQSLLAHGAGTPDVNPPQKTKIATSQMILEFEDGWLTRWENLETSEKVEFGKPAITRSGADRQYAPGPWWVDWKLPGNLLATGTQWKMNVAKVDGTAVRLTESAERADDLLVHGVQWGIQVPYDQIRLLHIPKGMPPARLVGTDTLNMPLVPSIALSGRLGMDAGNWALRFYVIEGKTGGLLIYMEDPELEHYGTLEFKKGENSVIISNRSIAPPPWKSSYTGSRWVIRQFTGGSNVAAQLYQDYLAKAYHLTKVSERPTAWATKLGYDFVGSPWSELLPHKGKTRPSFNYTDAWEESMAVNTQWLENVAKVLKPESVLFYTGGWKLIPNIDKGIPDAGVDPFFVYMCPRARQMGFHVMLHFNGINLSTDTVSYARFWDHEAKARGDGELRGPIRNLYTGQLMGHTQGGPPGGWSEKMGWNPPSGEFTMNPADEQWRYILVSQIVSAIKATGADALHIDVPVLIPDMNCVQYGMNSMQGWRAFGKLLRGELDKNGLQHVAIATETTPNEGLLPYVDFAQAARSKSILGIVDGIASGKYTLSETAMITTQSGKDKDAVLRLREEMDRTKTKFNADYARMFLKSMKELSEPSINNMVIAPYVQAYPHLGSLTPVLRGQRGNPDDELKAQIVESLHMWASVQHDTPPNGTAWGWAMFMDVPPYDQLEVTDIYRKQSIGNPKSSIRKNGRIFSKFDYGKFALARFWGTLTPQIQPPGQWQPGDIGRYTLNDGKTLRVYRADPQTLRWEYVGGPVLTELDLFEGWKNDALLMKGYEPLWLKNQIDDYYRPAAGTVSQQ